MLQITGHVGDEMTMHCPSWTAGSPSADVMLVVDTSPCGPWGAGGYGSRVDMRPSGSRQTEFVYIEIRCDLFIVPDMLFYVLQGTDGLHYLLVS